MELAYLKGGLEEKETKIPSPEDDKHNTDEDSTANTSEESIETETEIPCEECIKDFSIHKDLLPDMCDLCIVSLSESEDIWLAENIRCEICQNTFRTKTQFKRHMNCKFSYESSLEYICKLCDLFWKGEDKFNQHMRLKHEIMRCVHCNLELRGKEGLDIHFRTKHRAF